MLLEMIFIDLLVILFEKLIRSTVPPIIGLAAQEFKRQKREESIPNIARSQFPSVAIIHKKEGTKKLQYQSRK